MPTTKLIELRPNKSLLNPNFDGYKLSLNPIPIIRQSLPVSPNRVVLSSEQYSYSHAQLFTLHNHLVNDDWSSHTGYFVDENRTIQKIEYSIHSGRFEAIKSVYRLPKLTTDGDDPKDLYNIQFKFISEKYCLLSNGQRSLYVIDTGDRDKTVEWKAIDVIEPIDGNFLLIDARFEIVDERKIIHCIVLSIQPKDGKSDGSQSAFQTVLDWICLDENVSADGKRNWTSRKHCQLEGSTLPTYCSLETKSKALLLASDSPFRFEGFPTTDEDKTVVKPSPIWSQTNEDVTIRFDSIANGSVKSDIKIVCQSNEINVRFRNDILLEGKLHNKIDSDLTTWTLENQSLLINLFKHEPNVHWTELLIDQTINESSDGSVQNPDPDVSGQITNLGTDMEDCDIEDTERECYFERIDPQNEQATHKIYLGTNHPLFAVHQIIGQPSAVGIRCDVDVCIYQPVQQTEWTMKHVGTLNAFGYVQASKQQKKFIGCSPDMTYAIISESLRHIFVYYSEHGSVGGLKNRNHSERVLFGQQKLVQLDGKEQVLGILIENDVTILLTDTHLLCLQINA